MHNIIYYFKYSLAIITAICLLVIMFIDPTNMGILLTFTLITIFSAFIPKRIIDLGPPEFKAWLDNVTICSFWFIIGFFIFKVTTTKDILAKIPYAIFFITFAIIVIIFSFSALLSIIYVGKYSQLTDKKVSEYGEKVKEYEKLLVSNSSGIRDFFSLLKIVKEEKPDIVIIAGNLLSMSTNEGASQVNEYLNQCQTNVIKLLIPESSKSLLSLVKTKIESTNLTRLEVFVADPFWFLQGIVILGRRKIANDDDRIDPYGCIFYKIKTSPQDDNSKEGIYIDLRNSGVGEIKDSFAAYYSLLNTLEYSEGNFKVKKIFTKNGKIFPPKTLISWDKV